MYSPQPNMHCRSHIRATRFPDTRAPPFLLFFGEAASGTNLYYLSLASEIGLIGSMLYFAFFGHVLARTWRLSSSMDPELRFFMNPSRSVRGPSIPFPSPCMRTRR